MRDAMPFIILGGIFLLLKGSTSMNIGMRHNNPLNIKFSKYNDWDGQDSSKSGTFVYFVNKNYGYRAAFKLMRNYISKYGANTIDKIVSRWAPPSENDTEHYINFVSDKTGIDKNSVVNESDLPSIVAAMAMMETGDRDGGALSTGLILSRT